VLTKAYGYAHFITHICMHTRMFKNVGRKQKWGCPGVLCEEKRQPFNNEKHIASCSECGMTYIAFCRFLFLPRREARGCLMSPSCLESQGCHFIPLSYLLSCFLCLDLLLFLSCHFSANGPFSGLFSRKLSNIFQ